MGKAPLSAAIGVQEAQGAGNRESSGASLSGFSEPQHEWMLNAVE